MSIYGCPDQELNNWKHSHFDLIFAYAISWKELAYGLSQENDIYYVGPFHTFNYLNYFCVKERLSSEPSTIYHDRSDWYKTVATTAEWPRGQYLIYSTMNDECPSGELI